jgi:2-polyprenyl-6-methoxyphenol hydroxylase-like FAD-dependent oxidoreductase
MVLLGAAVHPMPPGGLGANLAFRDARLLVALVARGGALPDALAEYQRQVLAYGAQARDQALAQLSSSSERTGFAVQLRSPAVLTRIPWGSRQAGEDTPPRY